MKENRMRRNIPKRSFTRRFLSSHRSGMAMLDYVMVSAIAVPISAVLLFIFCRGVKALYYIASVTLGWMFF